MICSVLRFETDYATSRFVNDVSEITKCSDPKVIHIFHA